MNKLRSVSGYPPAPAPPTPPQPPHLPLSLSSKTITKTTLFHTTPSKWIPLNLPITELSLPLTFPTAQTFLFKPTNPTQFTGPIGPHLISLKHTSNNHISFSLHNPISASSLPLATSALSDFLNLHISLKDLWDGFSKSDPMFGVLGRVLSGARVLRQDPVECLFQFICSSNNNVARITKMVDYLSGLGEYLGEVGGFEFHRFPSLERLSKVSEAELREAGFGYRAKYITGTVAALRSKPEGGAEWLTSLRKTDLQTAIDALCTLPGVGPKVAACIALFSLDQHHAIPVDTHVWKIATRYLLPELAEARLTPKLSIRVADAFVSKYGKYAGWAQTLLFIAELPAQKLLLPSNIHVKEGQEPVKRKSGQGNGAKRSQKIKKA